MRKRAGGKTSGRSRRAQPRKSTSAPSSSSRGTKRRVERAEKAEGAEKALRDQLQTALDWGHAHADFAKAVGDLPVEVRGRRPQAMPHSPWEILEHLRLAQNDILDFCRNPKYAEKKWPDEYWPPTPAPPDSGAWDASVRAFRRDLGELQALAANRRLDLFARIPHGTGQTYLRELILILDHNAYHVGELVAVRRMLGAWQ